MGEKNHSEMYLVFTILFKKLETLHATPSCTVLSYITRLASVTKL